MSDYYSPSGTPGTGAQGASSSMRAEFALIEAGFEKLPGLTGNDLKIVRVNAGGSALEAVSVTGSGSVVMNTSPTLVTPVLGAAAATSLSVSGQITSTQATGSAPLVVASTTKVTNLYADRAATADAVTTNANLTGPITSSGNATSVASQTGSGSKFVMDTSPTLVTPVLGAATATTINKVTVTQPASAATITIDDGKTLRASASLVLTGTDSTTHTFPSTNSTVARTDAAQSFTGQQTIANLHATGGDTAGIDCGTNRVYEGFNTLAPTSGAGATADWSKGGSKLTNNGTNVLSFSNIPAGLAGHIVICSNFNNTTFPATVDWGISGKPSIAGAAVASLVTIDGGAAKVYGSIMYQAV